MKTKRNAAWTSKRSQDAARQFLKARGFLTYRNTGGLLVCHLGRAFTMPDLLQQVQAFSSWARSQRMTSRRLTNLPAGIKEISNSKRTSITTVARIRSTYPNDATPARSISRASLVVEGSHGTVPGHYAELDWNDLRKR